MYNCKKCSRFLPLYSIRNFCHISFENDHKFEDWNVNS